MFFNNKFRNELPGPEEALPGREERIWPEALHYVLKQPMVPPFDKVYSRLILGMGCFWGAERLFWQIPGVYTTAVGYTAGITLNPTYEEVCTGKTAHTEAVLVVYDKAKVTLLELLTVFWENHDPTQGMRQGNDTGTQYRSGLYLDSDEELNVALETKKLYQGRLLKEGQGEITTEVMASKPFFYAEEYHQQYLAKNPNGYCGIGGCGVKMNK